MFPPTGNTRTPAFHKKRKWLPVECCIKLLLVAKHELTFICDVCDLWVLALKSYRSSRNVSTEEYNGHFQGFLTAGQF